LQITDATLRVGNDEHCCSAQVAELVDALVSGISGGNTVEVRVFSWAPKFKKPSQPTRFFIAPKKAASVFSGHAPAKPFALT
jgi:hypothetical protein